MRFRVAAPLSVGLCLLPVLGARTGHAELKVAGEGKTQTLVRQQFPPDHAPRYDLFASKCTKCHPMARPIYALQTGITPVSGNPFEVEDFKKYVVKMMRKPNSGIDKEEARQIILFIAFARELARRGG